VREYCLRPQMALLTVPGGALSNVRKSSDGWPKMYYFELLRASKGTQSRWTNGLYAAVSLYLQLATINPHWARVVGYGPFSLWVVHKEGLCPSNGYINGLMMMMMRRQVVKIIAESLSHTYIHTYHSRFIPEAVAEVSQIFLRDTHILPKYVSYELQTW
jgi:hypothetical protein